MGELVGEALDHLLCALLAGRSQSPERGSADEDRSSSHGDGSRNVLPGLHDDQAPSNEMAPYPVETAPSMLTRWMITSTRSRPRCLQQPLENPRPHRPMMLPMPFLLRSFPGLDRCRGRLRSCTGSAIRRIVLRRIAPQLRQASSTAATSGSVAPTGANSPTSWPVLAAAVAASR
jgi:hypothetical protein